MVEVGQRMFLWCDGEPAVARSVVWPPPTELDAEGGTYVLVDDGDPSIWRYAFVPVTMRE